MPTAFLTPEIATPLSRQPFPAKMPRFANRRTRYARKRTYKRAPVRRSGGVTKTRRTYRPKTTSRRLVDKMSRKKRDVMQSAGNTTPNAPPDATLTGGDSTTILANGIKDGISLFPYCPTYRFLKPNNAAYISQRTASACWLKGISETITFVPSDGSTWIWRRYILRFKDRYTSTAFLQNYGAENQATGTTARRWRNFAVASSNNEYNTEYDRFQEQNYLGVKTTDWSNQMNAKLDKTKFDVISDKRVHLRSGNQAGAPRVIKKYHRLNSWLRYDDEENGTSITVSPVSVTNKIGKGNIFIFDLFSCPAPINATTTSLTFNSNMTMYWHEK